MESTKCEKERLAQKCHDLEMQLNLMKEEKSNLSGAVRGSVLYVVVTRSPQHNALSGICYPDLPEPIVLIYWNRFSHSIWLHVLRNPHLQGQ